MVNGAFGYVKTGEVTSEGVEAGLDEVEQGVLGMDPWVDDGTLDIVLFPG